MSKGLVVRTQDLTKYYGPVRGVEGVHLAVAEGEVFGLLGPNGAGKTTMLRLLLGFIRPTAGSASVFDLDAWADATAIKARVAYLPSTPNLYGEASGHELLDLLGRFRGGLDRSRCEELADRLQVDLARPVQALSRGTRQKLSLLLAFALDAPLLVLDEPSTGLDPLMQFEVVELMREQRRRSATVLLASHSLREVEQVCDRVAMLREGRLLAVEEVGKLRSKMVRQMEVLLERALDPGELHLDGVAVLEASGRRLRLAVRGPLDELMSLLAGHGIRDLTCAAPDLQEVFLHYYRQAVDEQPVPLTP
ncbi:MAG: ABC transporter ATP-binding protein [Chloroflexi bacterium]|nr:ABC transporter ATP-binding protein [Chloroflexota bacterium]